MRFSLIVLTIALGVACADANLANKLKNWLLCTTGITTTAAIPLDSSSPIDDQPSASEPSSDSAKSEPKMPSSPDQAQSGPNTGGLGTNLTANGPKMQPSVFDHLPVVIFTKHGSTSTTTDSPYSSSAANEKSNKFDKKSRN